MTSMINKLLLFGALLLVLAGCDDSNPVNTNVSETQRLYTPEDGFSVTLEPNGSETFEWAPAKAEDGGMVMYEVAFDSVGGDFSDPLYRVVSSNNGIGTSVTVSHGTLNKAAAQAGLEAQETGQMDWTVITSRGVNETVSPAKNTIQVTRLAGFANPPTNLYITGEGTEAGGSLENAMQLKSTGDGQFEIYTRLTTDGSFEFVTNTTGSPRQFSIQEGTIKENDSGSTVDEAGVYRIRLDFTTGAANIAQIEKLEFYSAPHDEFLFELPYQSEGVFKAEDQPYSFYEWDWGLDSRYKFRMTVSQNGEQSYEWWGNDQADVSRPNDSSPPSYWYLYPVPESSDQWQYTYKFQEDKHQSIIDVTAYFQPDSHYTHEVVKVGDQ